MLLAGLLALIGIALWATGHLILRWRRHRDPAWRDRAPAPL